MNWASSLLVNDCLSLLLHAYPIMLLSLMNGSWHWPYKRLSRAPHAGGVLHISALPSCSALKIAKTDRQTDRKIFFASLLFLIIWPGHDPGLHLGCHVTWAQTGLWESVRPDWQMSRGRLQAIFKFHISSWKGPSHQVNNLENGEKSMKRDYLF